MFRARPTLVVMLTVALTLFAQEALGQEVAPERVERLENVALDFTPVLMSTSAAAAVRLSDFGQIPMAPVVARRAKIGGSALLSSLYASTAIMQGLDVHSTLKAFSAGAVEGNPVMAGVTRNRAAFMVTKAAVAAVTILATRKIAKKNKVMAVVTLVAVNGAYAMIARHNYSVASRR